jgi:ligand-binding sensor domain-containing protein/signal transduction histidine kinase
MKPPGMPWMVVIFLAGLAAYPCSGVEEKVLDTAETARKYDQRTWQHAHGLPAGDRAWTVIQTRDGYVWIGTQYGLARFDGRRFTIFDHVNTPELTNEDCRTLTEDREGNLWIGTGDGLVVKRNNHLTHLAARLGQQNRSFPPLFASLSGGVWVAGVNGVCHIRGNDVRHYPQDQTEPLGGGIITSLEETEPGMVWVGTANGLCRLNAATGRYENLFKQTPFEGFPVFAIRGDAKGGIWVHFLEYPPHADHWNPMAWLARVDANGDPRAPVIIDKWRKPGSQGIYLATGPDGILWFPGSLNGAIRRYRDASIESMPVPLRKDEDFTLGAYVDREENLWIGTSHSGLQCWIPKKATVFTASDGLLNENIWTLCEARDGSVWVGTDEGLVRVKDGHCTVLRRPDGSVHKEVRALAEDLDGNIWVGTMRSLDIVRGGEVTPVNLPGEWFEEKTRALLAGRDGAMWIGTVRGLTRLHQGQRTKYTRAEGLGSDEARAILEDRQGILWVGTLGGGLSRFENGRFQTLTTANGLSSDNVWALHEDVDGVIWAGTDNGLNRIEKGQIMRITEAQGLPDKLVNSVISDGHGRLWVGHDRGIYALHRAELDELAQGLRSTVTAVEYGEADGLPSAETNGQKSNPAVCRTGDGRLWFPTTRGVVVLDPTKVNALEVPPLSVIEEVRANGNQVLGNLPGARDLVEPSPDLRERGLDLELPPGGARVLEFDYTANTFVAPEKARFKYRLLGLDDTWIDAGTRRQAYFTNLRPGKYRFELQACNHQGLWQETSAAVAFYVTPFYYQTWWFYSGCAVAATALGSLLIGWRLRESRRIYELERVNALNEQRRRIARDIHDELGSSLTHIMRLSDPERSTPTAPPLPEDKTGRIASIAGEAVDSIGEIVWANNPEYDTLEDLVAYLREHAASYFADSEILVAFDFPEEIPTRSVPGLFRRNVVMVMKEALQNITKHARARQVNLRLTVTSDRLELCISDDGQGLPTGGTRRFGNGLTNMRQRIEELKGTFTIESRSGAGTEIRAVIPFTGP